MRSSIDVSSYTFKLSDAQVNMMQHSNIQNEQTGIFSAKIGDEHYEKGQ